MAARSMVSRSAAIYARATTHADVTMTTVGVGKTLANVAMDTMAATGAIETSTAITVATIGTSVGIMDGTIMVTAMTVVATTAGTGTGTGIGMVIMVAPAGRPMSK